MSPRARRFLVFTGIVLVVVGLTFGVLADSTDAKDESRIIIKNNTLSDSGFGIYVGPKARDHEYVIEGNKILNNAEAIRLTGLRNQAYIRNNDIQENIAGITLRDKYADNEEGFVKYPMNPENIFISDNNFFNNEEGNILNFLEKKTTDGEVNKSSNDSGQAASEPEEEENSRKETGQEETGEDTNEGAGKESSGEASSDADNAAAEEVESSKTSESSEEEVTSSSDKEASDEQEDGSSPDSNPEVSNVSESSSDNHEEEANQPANGTTQANGLTQEGEEVSLNWGMPLLMAGGTLIALISLLLLAKGGS
ncbi:hypothetical protein KGY71_04735 [Candidatus Bipolaricaulota bacterium]|nr:hypothetical protein [Candidatus Bipolaricaulota bacterium]